MTSTAYSRPSKLPGGVERRLPPRLMRSLTSKIEPKKLGVGLLAGCCLALLTYVSLAKLFAIYSPVFGTHWVRFDSISISPDLIFLTNLIGAARFVLSQHGQHVRPAAELAAVVAQAVRAGDGGHPAARNASRWRQQRR
jgi:hypothetical protein